MPAVMAAAAQASTANPARVIRLTSRVISTAPALVRNWSSVPALVSTMARFSSEPADSRQNAPKSRRSPQRAVAASTSKIAGIRYRSCMRWARQNTAAP